MISSESNTGLTILPDFNMIINEVNKLKLSLRNRTADHVAVYFHNTNQEIFRSVLPQKAKTVEEAIADYEKTLLPSSTSYGRTIYVDDHYIGDVWCYCIDYDDTPNAMISYCIFQTEYWNQGIATEAVKLFVVEFTEKFQLDTIGAFTFADNFPSIRVLEKCGFHRMEEITENGRLSYYFELNTKKRGE